VLNTMTLNKSLGMHRLAHKRYIEMLNNKKNSSSS
jgi:hypothetical protein